MRYKVAKVKESNCGASVKAAGGGYMAVEGNGIDITNLKKPKSGYSKGGYAKKATKKASS